MCSCMRRERGGFGAQAARAQPACRRPQCPPKQVVVEEHSSTYFMQTRAADAVATCLWALCRHWGHPEAAIEGAIHYGARAWAGWLSLLA